MKKLYLLVLSIAIASIAMAQVTGGGKVTEQSQPVTVVKKKADKGVFKNTFYFAWATASPKGRMNKTANSLNDIVTYGYGGMASGLSFTMGSNFYFKEIDMTKLGMSDQFKLGLDVTYSSATICKKLNETLIDGIEDLNLFYGAIKIGPVLSFNPVGKLVIDAKFTLQPTVVNYYNRFSAYRQLYNANYYESVEGTAFKLRKGLGIYARYRPLMIGFELSWGKVKFNDFGVKSLNTFEYNEYGNYYYATYNYNSFEKTLGSTRFDFVFGFSF